MKLVVMTSIGVVAMIFTGTAVAQRPQDARQMLQRIMSFDSNGDGSVSSSEAPPQMWQRLRSFDANGDNVVDQQELAELAKRFAGDRTRPSGRPDVVASENEATVGKLAPDFKLSTQDGKFQVELASFRGQQPVALIFGSYT